jgi:hypothetical protein
MSNGVYDIGWAVEAMREGHFVRRTGWNGKGMWLTLHKGGLYSPGNRPSLPILDYIMMKTADDKFVPWLCSQTDLLASDWELAQ